MSTSAKNWVEGGIDGVTVRAIRKFTDQRGWLGEAFRSDELPDELRPEMGYVSMTRPGVARGPHAHRDQTDIFAFYGPGVFEVKLWDNRPGSRTYGRMTTLRAGADQPQVVIVPPGVVHGYKNVADCDGLVVNLPNRLYAGKNRKSPVDEIRYEDNPDSGFRM